MGNQSSAMAKINGLLKGSYVSPSTTHPVGVNTRSLEIQPSLAGAELAMIQALDFGQKLAVVSDPDTHAALGKRVEDALTGGFRVKRLQLPQHPHPDDRTVAALEKEFAEVDAVIAVGSGTINDLCKFGSARLGKPYAVFATAPSMNGYTSLNAAITVHGHKLSLPAQAPRGVFFDLEVLAAAPARLIRSGLGDSLCRCTAQADWLLAHLILDTPYSELPFELLKDDEAPLFNHARVLMAGDLDVMAMLVRTLVLAGFGTAIIGNSGPASQGEHLISHYIDMFEPKGRPTVYHGEQVGVTTVTMARLQEEVLAQRPMVRPDTISQVELVSRYGAVIGESCWAEFSKKQVTPELSERLNDILASRWPEIRDQVGSISLTPAYLSRVLQEAGAGVTPESIHLAPGFYSQAILHCREIRNRFTHLDLAAVSGLLPRLSHII